MKNKLQYYVKYAIIGMEIYIFTINAMLFGILHIKGGFKMEQKEMKKVVKRVVKKVLKETYYKDIEVTKLVLNKMPRVAKSLRISTFPQLQKNPVQRRKCVKLWQIFARN